jgi:reversibly glycosylated polypeptide/UDP-arabinopyranose mutase
MANKIAVVVPTTENRSLVYKTFFEGWFDLFDKHRVELIKVQDGDKPKLFHNDVEMGITEVMGKDSYLIFNKNDGVRNLGFAYIAKYLPDVEYIITLDDDTLPKDGEDPIQLHLDALNTRFPLGWMSTASDYVRGIPYWNREQSECVVSHGVWEGVMDWDAPTQLVKGNRQLDFYKGVIPRGVYFPFCGMNIAFKRKMLPYMYYAPMGHKVGMDRFADIWLGIHLRRICDDNGWSIATGYSTVRHERASNVWDNLKKESQGLELNEHYFEGVEDHPYFKIYNDCRRRWINFINSFND